MNYWVVKCNEQLRDGSLGWHWGSYFYEEDQGTLGGDFDFGGEKWIRSALSLKYLREEVARADICVCYQSERREIMGIAQITRGGYEEIPGSGIYNTFNLQPASEAFPFIFPVTVQELRDFGADPKCFKKGTQGTIFPVMPMEFAQIVTAYRSMGPGPKRELNAWLRAHKVSV